MCLDRTIFSPCLDNITRFLSSIDFSYCFLNSEKEGCLGIDEVVTCYNEDTVLVVHQTAHTISKQVSI